MRAGAARRPARAAMRASPSRLVHDAVTGAPQHAQAVPTAGDYTTQSQAGLRGAVNYLLSKYALRNVFRRAARVQVKRDWHQAYVNLVMHQREREGLPPLPPEEIEERFMRWRLTWSAALDTRAEAHQLMMRQIEQGLRAVSEDRLDEHLGFRLSVRDSTLPPEFRSFQKHGLGLHVDGRAPAGTVLGLAPGMCWWGWHMRMMPWSTDTEGNYIFCSPHVNRGRRGVDLTLLCSDFDRYPLDFRENASDLELKQALAQANDVVANELTNTDGHGTAPKDRFDGSFQRVRQAWYPIFWWFKYRMTLNRGVMPYRAPRDWAIKRAAMPLCGMRWDHDFARLNYVNHCGSTRDPNVIYVPIWIPVEFPVALLPYVPSRMFAAEKYGQESYFKQLMTGDDQVRLQADLSVAAQQHLGKSSLLSTNDGQSDFLAVTYSVAAVATRPIENEEVLVNMRFPTHRYHRARWPAWYMPHPDAYTSEDWLANNLWPPDTSALGRAFGIYDPGVTLSDALEDTRVMDRDIFYYLRWLCGKG